MIDLRSDTVTQPTEGMRQAMAEAIVGDDVFGDDPTVNSLQTRVAAMLGHEDALWVPSGTMGNAVALRTHTQPGDEIIAEATSHIFEHEVGGAAALCGALIRTIESDDGCLPLEAVRRAVRTPDVHHTITRVIAAENTHNFRGGMVAPLASLEALSDFARSNGIAFHLDGARLWNAHVASGVPLTTFGRLFDSISVCLSKGLGAPAGSVLTGPRRFIERARRFRKMFGGGMRQVGVLAAAGHYALDHNLKRMHVDHENAKLFADACLALPGVRLAQKAVHTNIVFIDVSGSGRSAPAVEAAMHEDGVALIATTDTTLRAVFHLHISQEDAGRAAESLKRAVTTLAVAS